MDNWTGLGTPRICRKSRHARLRGLEQPARFREFALCRTGRAARSGARTLNQNSNSVVEEFNFEEETDGHEGKKYSWMNAARRLVNINRAHKEYGWTVKSRRAISVNAGC